MWLKFNNCADLDRSWLWLWFPHMRAIGPPSEQKSAISSSFPKRENSIATRTEMSMPEESMWQAREGRKYDGVKVQLP